MVKNVGCGDFPGGPGVEDPPSSAGGTGSIPGRGTRSHVPQLRPSTEKKNDMGLWSLAGALNPSFSTY